jgi:outer membrane protein OmpA-like peptidoglycan-associated protein
VSIEGHTDNQGPDDYNQDLSERRAASVRRYLISQGVESERLRSKGFGESQPIDDNRTAAGRAENRRVEFLIIKQ